MAMRYIRSLVFCVVVCAMFYIWSVPINISASSKPQEGQKCNPLSDIKIPGDGSWIQICVVDPGAPENSTVTETNVKVLVEHPDPGQLEIRLRRTDSNTFLTLSPDTITKDGVGKFTKIHDFDGMPSQGEWVIQIRDTVSGMEGIIKSVSIASLYTPGEKMHLPISNSDGKPTSERIAVGAKKIPGSAETDEKKEFDNASEMQLYTGFSVPIMTQTFERIFPPSTGWSIYDANPND